MRGEDDKLEHDQLLSLEFEEAFRNADGFHGGKQALFVGIKTQRLHKVFWDFKQRKYYAGYHGSFDTKTALLESFFSRESNPRDYLLNCDPIGSKTLVQFLTRVKASL